MSRCVLSRPASSYMRSASAYCFLASPRWPMLTYASGSLTKPLVRLVARMTWLNASLAADRWPSSVGGGVQEGEVEAAMSAMSGGVGNESACAATGERLLGGRQVAQLCGWCDRCWMR
jgi:hypothetical protein